MGGRQPNRQQFLELASVAGGLALAGCNESASESPSPSQNQTQSPTSTNTQTDTSEPPTADETQTETPAPAFEIETIEPADRSPTTLTAAGRLTGDVDSPVEVGFQYGPAGDELPDSVYFSTVTSEQDFTRQLVDLEPETEYEIAAVGRQEGQQVTGNIQTTETEPAPADDATWTQFQADAQNTGVATDCLSHRQISPNNGCFRLALRSGSPVLDRRCT